jgi:transposase
MEAQKPRERQQPLRVAVADLPNPGGRPFCVRLNQSSGQYGLDTPAEEKSPRHCAEKMGTPRLTPGLYFRLLLIGYFHGISSERGITWRLADSMALRRSVWIWLDQTAPDHSTTSPTRRPIDVETPRDLPGGYSPPTPPNIRV